MEETANNKATHSNPPPSPTLQKIVNNPPKYAKPNQHVNLTMGKYWGEQRSHHAKISSRVEL